MEYRSVNEPQNFYYHDSYLDSIEFLSADMILTVSLNNVESDNSQNDTGKALQVNAMRITFADYRIKSGKKYGSKTFDSNKNIIQETPDISLAPRDAENCLNSFQKKTTPVQKLCMEMARAAKVP